MLNRAFVFVKQKMQSYALSAADTEKGFFK